VCCGSGVLLAQARECGGDADVLEVGAGVVGGLLGDVWNGNGGVKGSRL